jgi:hypothetical protein
MTSETIIGLVTALMPILIALAVALYRWLLQLMPAERASKVDDLVQLVVSGVEQQLRTAPGDQKKTLALQALDAILKARGITLSPAEKEIRIEHAVAKLPKTGITGHADYTLPDTEPV